ncbi:hypothetical protein [Clostridium sp. SM-530-WT-3G]|uniref:hypothetical protein n=1 Tax=Clostridium sp. SM-530-WT-3G TaxID=2725303 RepID=UPI00145EC53C|nr:hypothetical protein [Clostridium sp. SM-530-WT-3G]NME82578.1 hypothetical protein [Clostridium sp. SM-530-WT-3G]
MDIIYVKYNGLKRQTVIKNKSNIIKDNTLLSNNNSKIVATPSKIVDIQDYKDNECQTLDDEISNYFFEQIHKNYLKYRKLSQS